ncbi:hypothetical protein, partial [Brevundimonas sp.]|uniref:hypothetical protein n=1 Tax=Brevundimonas sp. TaxID=1871086 RepID=UPI00378438B6
TLKDIDLSSAEYRADRRTGRFLGIAIRLRFGEARDCYLNDDGRGTLYIRLSMDGEHDASASSPDESCEPVGRDLPVRMLAPPTAP